MDPSKFQLERDIVDRFLRELGHGNFSLSDPNAGRKTDTGADVLVTLSGVRYGIQVTRYHSDEGMHPGGRGSNLRRQEAAYRGWNTAYAMCGNPIPWSGLVSRIHAKCIEAHPEHGFDELVLLVASSVPEWSGLVSTLLLDIALDLDQMNSILSPILRRSPYSSVYLYNMMGVGGPSVHEWTRESGIWRKIPRAASA
jgi:hypothetical protein